MHIHMCIHTQMCVCVWTYVVALDDLKLKILSAQLCIELANGKICIVMKNN